MSDIRINLLPWRDERREHLKQEFLQVLFVFAAVAVFIIVVFDRYYNITIDTQNDRNTYMRKEINVLDDKIAEIKVLQAKKMELLARMKVIQDLQGNRPVIVRVFDEIVRQLAPKVFYQSMDFKGDALNIMGIADSNNRISTQLRNFEESEWFQKPSVSAITADLKRGPQAMRFALKVIQTAPKKAKDNAAN